MSDGTILVVDDEEDLRKVLDFNLRNAGFETLLAATGSEALELARQEHPDLILLDLMLPDIQGTEVCRRLKTDAETRDIPVMMVTARGGEIDRVVGFEIGADDYVVKPFSVREVVLRVKAVLKRTAEQAPDAGEESEGEEHTEDGLIFGDLHLDPARHRVWIGEDEVKLTATEFRLLETFLSRRGRVQTRDMLLQNVWGSEINVTPRTVDTHVKRLREKLDDYGRYIETVRGVGYRFSESP